MNVTKSFDLPDISFNPDVVTGRFKINCNNSTVYSFVYPQHVVLPVYVYHNDQVQNQIGWCNEVVIQEDEEAHGIVEFSHIDWAKKINHMINDNLNFELVTVSVKDNKDDSVHHLKYYILMPKPHYGKVMIKGMSA